MAAACRAEAAWATWISDPWTQIARGPPADFGVPILQKSPPLLWLARGSGGHCQLVRPTVKGHKR